MPTRFSRRGSKGRGTSERFGQQSKVGPQIHFIRVSRSLRGTEMRRLKRLRRRRIAAEIFHFAYYRIFRPIDPDRSWTWNIDTECSSFSLEKWPTQCSSLEVATGNRRAVARILKTAGGRGEVFRDIFPSNFSRECNFSEKRGTKGNPRARRGKVSASYEFSVITEECIIEHGITGTYLLLIT